MKFKPVFTWDERRWKIRLFRLLWTCGAVGDGKGYSAKLSFSLVPSFLAFAPEYAGWSLTVFGLQVHHTKAYGGIIP